MGSRKNEMYTIYLLPAVFGVLRIVATIMLIILTGRNFRMKWFQLISIIVIISSLFRMYRLYVDAVPVVSLLLPSIAQCVLSAAFFGSVPVFYISILVIIDILFMFSKSFKASQIPFQIEGDEFNDTDVLFSELDL